MSEEETNVFSSFHVLTKTKNEIPIHLQEFLHKMEKEMGLQFYYFGSIQREDYIPGLSDIDIDVFAKRQSPKNVVMAIANRLHISFQKIKKIEWTIPLTGKRVSGYKIKYRFHNAWPIEFSIYSFVDQPYVLYHHAEKLWVPFWVGWILIVLKYLFYKYHILPSSFFYESKRWVMSYGMGIAPDEFLIHKYASIQEFLDDPESR